MCDDKALEAPGKKLIKAAGMIIVAMAAVSTIIPLVAGFYGWTIFVAVFSLIVGILSMANAGVKKEARMLFAFGIVNLIALPFGMVVAIFHLMITVADENLQTFLAMFMPFVFMFLFFVSFAANVMLLVGALKNIKNVC